MNSHSLYCELQMFSELKWFSRALMTISSHLRPGQIQQVSSVTLVLAERNLPEWQVSVLGVCIFHCSTKLSKRNEERRLS